MKKKLIDAIFKIKDKIEKYNKSISTVVLIIYILSYVVMTIYHEPWFDEAQAWLIARDCSYKEILFTIGHYEGHPFLWYFILSIPAKLGVPFEIGLKTVGFIISTISAYLIIYKAPFPKIVNYIIPFTYFFFYQYGVIVRPYGLMLLLFIISAIVFKEKDEKPWKLVILLMLQCFLNAYGLLLSGGIAFCWCIDIFKEYNYSFKNLKLIIKDKRFKPLLVLLFSAIFVLLTIYSYPDTYSGANEAINSKLICFITAFSTLLADSLITTSPIFAKEGMLLQINSIDPYFVVVSAFISAILTILLLCFSSKNKVKYLFIIYLIFSIFSGLVYFGSHHIGILTLYIFFWCWINCEDLNKYEIGHLLKQKIKIKKEEERKFIIIGIVILTICLSRQINWSVTSNILDIQYQYSYGREASNFLKTSGLDQLNVVASWITDVNDKKDNNIYENMNTCTKGIPTLILAYYEHNFVYNVHNGENKSYVEYMKADSQTNENNIALWRQKGIPDVLIGKTDVELLTDGNITIDDYSPVYKIQINYIFKGSIKSGKDYIYVRKDLVEKYYLEELDVFDGSIKITEEMEERYQNGESMLSILEPYFEKMGLFD